MKDKILGKVEELRGRITGNRGAQVKGKGRQVVGEAKRVGKEVAYDAEHPQQQPPEPADSTRPTSPPPA
jgi:hypothetical protein